MWKAEPMRGGAEKRQGSVFDVGGLPPSPCWAAPLDPSLSMSSKALCPTNHNINVTTQAELSINMNPTGPLVQTPTKNTRVPHVSPAAPINVSADVGPADLQMRIKPDNVRTRCDHLCVLWVQHPACRSPLPVRQSRPSPNVTRPGRTSNQNQPINHMHVRFRV